MKRQWRSFQSLTIASIKMYFRNVTAVFFTLFIPIFLIVIFGVLSRNSGGNIKLDVTNYSQTDIAKQFVDQLKKVPAFKVNEVSESTASDELGKGNADLQVIISKDFGEFDKITGKLKTASIKSFYNEGRPQNGQTAGLILSEIINGFNNQITKTPQIITLQNTGVKTNNQGILDFLLPGVMAFSIMQLGIFSVAFGFIAYKTTGALRRLQVTPTHPINFVLGQSVARLIIGVLQVLLLLGLGIVFFHIHLLGNLLALLLVATIGVVVFLAFGFSIAGWARDENQAAPIANLVTFPMLFLSGVFFPREGLPNILQKITNFLPLTYLVDGMRRIANEGATLWQLKGDIVGLVVWGVIVFFIAIRVFKWE